MDEYRPAEFLLSPAIDEIEYSSGEACPFNVDSSDRTCTIVIKCFSVSSYKFLISYSMTKRLKLKIGWSSFFFEQLFLSFKVISRKRVLYNERKYDHFPKRDTRRTCLDFIYFHLKELSWYRRSYCTSQAQNVCNFETASKQFKLDYSNQKGPGFFGKEGNKHCVLRISQQAQPPCSFKSSWGQSVQLFIKLSSSDNKLLGIKFKRIQLQ